PPILQKAWDIIRSRGPDIGLFPNASMCDWVPPAPLSPFSRLLPPPPPPLPPPVFLFLLFLPPRPSPPCSLFFSAILFSILSVFSPTRPCAAGFLPRPCPLFPGSSPPPRSLLPPLLTFRFLGSPLVPPSLSPPLCLKSFLIISPLFLKS